jgi:hypothetical protein
VIAKENGLLGKKQYEQPNLRVYGDVRVLTQAVGMMSTGSDGGTGTSKKT